MNGFMYRELGGKNGYVSPQMEAACTFIQFTLPQIIRQIASIAGQVCRKLVSPKMKTARRFFLHGCARVSLSPVHPAPSAPRHGALRGRLLPGCAAVAGFGRGRSISGYASQEDVVSPLFRVSLSVYHSLVFHLMNKIIAFVTIFLGYRIERKLPYRKNTTWLQ